MHHIYKFLSLLILFNFSLEVYSGVIMGQTSVIFKKEDKYCGEDLSVVASWTSLTETNNDYFEVYRNGVKISGKINSCGTCVLHSYSFKDNGPFIRGLTYFYQVKATSNAGNTKLFSLGYASFPIPQSEDWQKQTSSTISTGLTSPLSESSYNWHEETNTNQGVIINLNSHEKATIFLEQNNNIINFNTQPNKFFVDLQVNVNNQGYFTLYNGNSKDSHIWQNSSSYFSSQGIYSLKVKYTDPFANIITREFEMKVIPKSSKLYKDNYCNTMRLWEGNDPKNEVPIVLSEGFDAYNVRPSQYYLAEGKDLINCLLDAGFKVYVLNYRVNYQDIKRNSAVYSSSIRHISNINNKPVLAAGISMGGIIARYATTWAEQNNNPLPVYKLITFDSPHQGAYVSKPLQDFLKSNYQNNGGDPFAEHANNNMAAKQLLSYNAYDINSGTSSSIHNQFYNNLNSLNGNGYPNLIENIGVSFSTIHPNLASGKWLEIQAQFTTGNITQKTIYLTNEEKKAGSYLPPVEAAPFKTSWKWYLNFLVTPTVVTNQFEKPTFISHESSLDIKNGSSPFDEVIIPSTTGFHHKIPDEIIEPVMNAIIKDNIYLQNKSISGTKHYVANKEIFAGKNVTTKISNGDYIVKSTGDVTFQAGKKINIRPGFKTEPGSRFHAYIEPDFKCTQNYSQYKKGQDDNSNEQKSDKNQLNTTNNNSHIIKKRIGLIEVYPNPFNSTATLTYKISKTKELKISILDIYGKKIEEICEKRFVKKGLYQEKLNFEHLSSGIYFVQLQTEKIKQVKKIIKR